MERNNLNVLRIGIFYDGYYFYKISNYYKYEHEKKSRISISGLHDFIRSEVAALTKTDIRQCRIIDAHYFKGRSSARELGEKVQSERVFEDILMRENIVSHYLPLRFGDNNTVQEKGIDVWLALEAYELAIYKHFDILVLVAGDGDYVPLVRKLHTVGTHVMLICWDFSYHNENGDIVETKTSRQLQEEVFFPVFMCQRIEQNDSDYIKELFVTEKNYEKFPVVNLKTELVPVQEQEEFVSTIYSINPNGFGFIKDEEHNNVFFHYSRVTNCEFYELKFGMNVKYAVEEDVERSKKDGASRFRATKVTVID
ncbi:MAG: NYN domain-containing protein [Spirochaetes bacterium]|nr:NYN domain-containing protein [Brevinematales bacterium]MCL1959453.1 NYN domain-containing protein [Spirochaetota bacterium]